MNLLYLLRHFSPDRFVSMAVICKVEKLKSSYYRNRHLEDYPKDFNSLFY